MARSFMDAAIEFFGLAHGQTRMQLGKEIMAAFPTGSDARKECAEALSKHFGEPIPY